MGQIVSSAAKPKRCNANQLSQVPTPAAGEHILVSSDNSMNAAGQGNFDCYIVGDGTTAATALPLHYINPELYDAQEVHVDMAFGAIGWADGAIGSLGNTSYLYTPTPIQVAKSMAIEIHNPTQHSLSWVRYFYYLDGTLVSKGTIINATSNALLTHNIIYDGTFNEVRINASGASAFSSSEDVYITYEKTTSVIPSLQERISEVDASVEALDREVEELGAEIDSIVGRTFPVTPTWIASKRIDTTNASASKIINASSDYAITDYIEVPAANAKLIASGLHGASNIHNPSINYYDASKNHIGYVYADGSVEEEIPTGVAFVVISQVTISSYPTANVTLSFSIPSQFASREELEATNEIVAGLGDIKSVTPTNDDIDAVSNPNFAFDENGNLVTKSSIASGGSAFMLFKENIKAIEFTINANWGYGADFCFGYGYHDNTLCNIAIVTMGTYKGTIISSGAAGAATDGLDANASVIGAYGRGLQTGRIFQKMPDVAIGDRCMMEIVCDKYICCYVWKNNKWEDWLMIFPTDLWSFCNIQNDGVRLRYGWNERFGLGVSIPNYNLAGGTTLLSNVKILSKTNTHLFDYHNSVTMRRGRMLKKNWLILGDSLSSINSDNGWGYVGYAERRTLHNAINLGVSGMYLAGIWRQKDTIGWETQVSALAMGDIVTIEGGGNDFIREGDTGVTITLENPNDNYDDTTTLGCLRRIIERIIELNPYVSINVITNQYTKSFTNDTNLAGHTMNYFYGKICEVAKEYNLPYLQLNVECVANKYNITGLSYDDIHPNQVGSEIIGELVAKMLL